MYTQPIHEALIDAIRDTAPHTNGNGIPELTLCYGDAMTKQIGFNLHQYKTLRDYLDHTSYVDRVSLLHHSGLQVAMLQTKHSVTQLLHAYQDEYQRGIKNLFTLHIQDNSASMWFIVQYPVNHTHERYRPLAQHMQLKMQPLYA